MNYIYAAAGAFYTVMFLIQGRRALWLYRYGRTYPAAWTRPHRQRVHLCLFLSCVCFMLLCSLLCLYNAFRIVGFF